MSTSNQELARRWFEEIWNEQRRETVTEHAHPEIRFHECGQTNQGPDFFLQYYDQMRSRFSDIHMTVHDTIGEGDVVCVRWSCRLRHTGEGMGVPLTGRVAEVTGISMIRVQDGKFIEGWQNWDMLGLLEQLGIRGDEGTRKLTAAV